MNIRDAIQEDNQSLIELQRKCPMGTDLVLQLDSSPDFFSRSRGYEAWHVLVAEEEGKLLGAAGYTVQDKPIGGEMRSMVYEYGFMVDPDVRRRGVASALQMEIEKRTADSDILHLNIIEGNAASHGFFTVHGFQRVRECVPLMVMAYKEHPVDKFKIRRMREDDIPVVVDLLNETYRGYEMYNEVTEGSFRKYYHRLPFHNMDDIYLYEGDTVLAVAGVWDYDSVMKFKLMEFDTKWKLMRMVTNFMGLFTAMPKMPDVGEEMTNWYLTPIGIRDAHAANQLLGYLLNMAYKQGVMMINLPMDANSHVKEIQGSYRHGSGSFFWYMKPVSGKELPEMGAEPMFVDIRDI
ncbi:GNAT family N-acetyltransferase [Candidatus Bathyarchaeota archaeon]|jgi:N-acetylglutamate synthase-like GNAT family acetyltransferase|nr:GNAT family N-acetyltransferase [Candidatus Bathyarchaeota archaeon]MBT4320983.1 GNAT family N-acetyltransferase [Candidatus Bathyarchaeota archaeon]MBT4424468.1 GNAT family N-acetyltransferase [Candidatus Bathyarchaeota archaeon]MBT5643372.1 GNAT family N-acetyltransferase [Candidatus Bathyarchaeota archaeon]MBT6604521.1 GNAT family N-acetyltransferase [Candidatus Bathyarchaeota archaeon]